MTLFASQATAAQTAGCQLIKVGELPVRFEHNRPMVPVTINGKPGWFLIDTGAAVSSLWGGAADSYGLRRTTAEGVKFYGVGGGQEGQYTTVQSFQLAGVKAENLRLFVMGQFGSSEDAGILGRDFLGNWDLEFDLPNKAVRLWTSRNCGHTSLAYWTKSPALAELDHDGPGDEYRVKVQLNGRAVNATLDSGATTSVVTPDVARMAGVRKQDYAPEINHTIGIGERAVPTRMAAFDKIAIGDEQVSNVKLRILDLFAGNNSNSTGSILSKRVELTNAPTMLLGADFLQAHRTMIAGSQRLIYFTHAGGPIFQSVGGVNEAPRPDSKPATPTPGN